MFRYEKQDNPEKKAPLKFYRVVDEERQLRLDLQRADQNVHEFWFWWETKCLTFYVERLPSAPATTDIDLSITTVRLYDRRGGEYLDDQSQLAIVVPLIHEALEAFWRGQKAPTVISSVTVADTLLCT